MKRTYSLPVHSSSWSVSKARTETGVDNAWTPGGGNAMRETYATGHLSVKQTGSITQPHYR